MNALPNSRRSASCPMPKSAWNAQKKTHRRNAGSKGNIAMLDEVKIALRTTTDATDIEIQTYIDAAIEDMVRVGIDGDYIESGAPLVKHAIILYVKAHYGYDNSEAPRFAESYRQVVCDLLNSSHNTAAING